MANWIFIIMHLAALFFALPFLFVTIPAHMIFAKMALKSELPDYLKHDGEKQCSRCAEWVSKGALVCKHCGGEF